MSVQPDIKLWIANTSKTSYSLSQQENPCSTWIQKPRPKHPVSTDMVQVRRKSTAKAKATVSEAAWTGQNRTMTFLIAITVISVYSATSIWRKVCRTKAGFGWWWSSLWNEDENPVVLGDVTCTSNPKIRISIEANPFMEILPHALTQIRQVPPVIIYISLWYKLAA